MDKLPIVYYLDEAEDGRARYASAALTLETRLRYDVEMARYVESGGKVHARKPNDIPRGPLPSEYISHLLRRELYRILYADEERELAWLRQLANRLIWLQQGGTYHDGLNEMIGELRSWDLRRKERIDALLSPPAGVDGYPFDLRP